MRDRDILARRVLRIGIFLDVIIGDLPGDLPDDFPGERLLGDLLLGDLLLGDFLLGDSLEELFVTFLVVLVADLPTLSAFKDKENIY